MHNVKWDNKCLVNAELPLKIDAIRYLSSFPRY